ncbi:MAG TPA: hypothetical protein VIU12_34745 [Chryseolinea sp.]
MKSKVIFLIAGAAVVTLSFTFVTNTRTVKVVSTNNSSKVSHNEPTGGLVSEDKF